MALDEVAVRSGPWDSQAVARFLGETAIPVRLASNGPEHPIVQSLWFSFDGAALWCCTHKDSILVARLTRDARCGFEVCADSPPYRGVRGTGTATAEPAAATIVLPGLISRYGQEGTPLATWLLSRIHDEVAIRISDLSVTSWDYSARMQSSSIVRGAV
jgi:hypothetical protein